MRRQKMETEGEEETNGGAASICPPKEGSCRVSDGGVEGQEPPGAQADPGYGVAALMSSQM